MRFASQFLRCLQSVIHESLTRCQLFCVIRNVKPKLGRPKFERGKARGVMVTVRLSPVEIHRDAEGRSGIWQDSVGVDSRQTSDGVTSGRAAESAVSV